jgi:hypothetical protein
MRDLCDGDRRGRSGRIFSFEGANSNRNKILVNVFNGFLQLVGCNEFSMYQLVCGNAAAPEQVTKNTTVYDGSR